MAHGQDVPGRSLPQGGWRCEGHHQPSGKTQCFRPRTVSECTTRFADAREDQGIGVVLLTGAGPHTDGKVRLLLRRRQSVRGTAGYVDEAGVPAPQCARSAKAHPFDAQGRDCARGPPTPLARHVLHVVCDLTIAADNAVFGQVGPRMGSFDGGFGSSYLARIVGQKKAREIWYLFAASTVRRRRWKMGLVNAVVPVGELEKEGVKWAREILRNSPLAIRCLKSAFNADRGRPGRPAGTRRETPRCFIT